MCKLRLPDFFSSLFVAVGVIALAALNVNGVEVLNLSGSFDEPAKAGIAGLSAPAGRPVATRDLADSDHDQMPDDWELANGLDPNDPSDAAADSDCDGKTNLQEYLAGTDPQVFDGLRILAIEPQANGHFQIAALGGVAHTYELQATTNFLTWNNVTDFWCKTGVARVDVAMTNDMQFYRLYSCTNAARVYVAVWLEPPTTNIQLLIAAPAGHFYALEGRTSLSFTDPWKELTNFYPLTCVTEIKDLYPSLDIRFYRVRLK